MKRFLTIALLLTSFFISQNSFAALTAGIHWEVRTTGSSNNGGGYDLASDGGTDYSQQDSAQLNPTDLAMTTGGTTLTSATGGFTAAMIDNVINITAGTNFTVGYYLITAYTDTNTVTLDRDATNGSNASSGTGYVGGATDHMATIEPSVVGGNTIWIKNTGTDYVKVGAAAQVLNLTVSGGNGTLINWRGYNSTHGDEPTGSDRPVWDGDSDGDESNDTTNIIDGNSTNGHVFRNRILRRASNDCVTSDGNNNYQMHFENVQMTLASDDGWAPGGGGSCTACEIDNNTDMGATSGRATGYQFFNSYIHDNGDDGWNHSYENADISIATVYDTNNGDGWNHAGNGDIISNSVLFNNAANGVIIWSRVSSAYAGGYIRNTTSTDNGTYGFNVNETDINQWGLFDYNNYEGNGTAGLNNINAGAHDNTTAVTWNSGPGPDFTISASDTALLNQGTPAIADRSGLTGSYHWNIGIDQDDNTQAGGGGGGGGPGWVSMSQ